MTPLIVSDILLAVVSCFFSSMKFIFFYLLPTLAGADMAKDSIQEQELLYKDVPRPLIYELPALKKFLQDPQYRHLVKKLQTPDVVLPITRLNTLQELEKFLQAPKYRRDVKELHIYNISCNWLIDLECPELLKISLNSSLLWPNQEDRTPSTKEILLALSKLKAPTLRSVFLREQVFSGKILDQVVQMPTVKELTIEPYSVIEGLEVFKCLKFSSLEKLTINYNVEVQSLKGIEAIAATLKSLEIVGVDFQEFNGHGLIGNFVGLEKLHVHGYNIKNLNIFKGMNAPKLKILKLSFRSIFDGMNMKDSKMFDGLLKMKTPLLQSIFLEISDVEEEDKAKLQERLKELRKKLPPSINLIVTF